MFFYVYLSISGQQSDFSCVDILLFVRAGAGLPAHGLAALQTCGGLPVCNALYHHCSAEVDRERASHAGHAVLLRGGHSQRCGLFLLYLQVMSCN